MSSCIFYILNPVQNVDGHDSTYAQMILITRLPINGPRWSTFVASSLEFSGIGIVSTRSLVSFASEHFCSTPRPFPSPLFVPVVASLFHLFSPCFLV